MNISVEKLEGSMAKLTIEIESDVFDKAIDTVYRKQRSKINVPGFRKGKAPRQLIEQMYGSDVFYEDASDEVINSEYPKAYDECEEDIVSQPEIEVVQMGRGKPFIFTAEVALRPEVKLGKYKGVSVSPADVSVGKKDVDEEIQRILKSNSRKIDVTDRPVETDDTVNIDYEGSVNSVPFEGGKAQGHDLKIGSNSFIPGFEDQLIGHSVGEEFNIDVTFPKEYHSADLAGKDAVFAIKINGIKAEEIPELNDEYVQDTTEFENVDEYKKDIKKKIKERKESAAKRQKQEEAVQKIVEDSKIDIPEAMLNTQVNSMLNDFARNMTSQGVNMQQYFQMTGTNPDTLLEQMRPEAENQIRTSLVLEEIAKKEKFEATSEEVDDRLAQMGAMYMISAEDLKKNMTNKDLDNIKKEVEVTKAVEFIGENAKEEAKKEKKEKKSTEKTEKKETKSKEKESKKKED